MDGRNNDWLDYLAVQRMDALMHYGVQGMHWYVRRYQPYSTTGTTSGKTGKEVGAAKRAGVLTRRSAYKAAKDINWHERNTAVRSAKQQKRVGNITKKEYKTQKKIANTNLKTANRAAKRASKNFSKEGAGRIINEAENTVSHRTAKNVVQTANNVIRNARYVGGIPISATLATSLVMMGFPQGYAAAMAASSLAGHTAGNKIGKEIVNSIINRMK